MIGDSTQRMNIVRLDGKFLRGWIPDNGLAVNRLRNLRTRGFDERSRGGIFPVAYVFKQGMTPIG